MGSYNSSANPGFQEGREGRWIYGYTRISCIHVQVHDVLFLFMEVGGLINFQMDEGLDLKDPLYLRDILLKLLQ